MSINWIEQERTLRTRDSLLRVIDERRRTARYSEQEDTRPICEHCNRHADFSEHLQVPRQFSLLSESAEQVWWECDWCGSTTESDPYQQSPKKPIQADGGSRALLATGTRGVGA